MTLTHKTSDAGDSKMLKGRRELFPLSEKKKKKLKLVLISRKSRIVMLLRFTMKINVLSMKL